MADKKGLMGWMFGGPKTKTERRSEEVEVGEIPSLPDDEMGAKTAFTVSLNDDGESRKETNVFVNANKTKVTNDTGLALVTVYACIDRISASIASIPFKVMKLEDGEYVEVENHPVTNALKNPPNDWMTSFHLIRNFMVDCLKGNGYIWFKKKYTTGEIIEVEWCPENKVDTLNTTARRWVYTYSDEYGNYHTIDPEDMIHVRALGNNNRKGLSPIMLHASTVKTGLDMQNYGENFFNGGAKPSGVVGVKGQLNNQGWTRLLNTWNSNSRRAMESTENRVMFLPADVTYTPISISPIDAALVQTMKLSRSEICGIYNVPGYMVGDLDKAYSGSVTAMLTSFVKNTLQPWATNCEQEFTKKLLSDDEIASGYIVQAYMRVLLRGTPQEMLQFFKDAATTGFITRNEGRAGLGYPKDKTDPQMNKFLVNVSQSGFADNQDNQDNPKTENPEEDNKQDEEEEVKENE